MKYKAPVEQDTLALPESDYPSDFLKAYEPLFCLAATSECETLYVESKHDGSAALAKCYRVDEMPSELIHESAILKKLDHWALPHFLEEYKSKAYHCVLREYIVGAPLNQYASDKSLEITQILDITIQLCDILTYLHGQKPPVIHRDIKPQNIILTDKGQVRLIDFGISRVYSTEAYTDTRHLGTVDFAPPEQYGFAQTDERSDIYSLGIVLGWMLTGESDPKKAAPAIANQRLKCIYKKCTAFAPVSRYATAQKLKAALLRVSRRRTVKTGRRVAAVLAGLAIAAIGFGVGRYTPLFAPQQALQEPAKVAFSQPLIEKAVRLQLNKGDTEVITPAELNRVTQLYISGEEAVTLTEEEYDRCDAWTEASGPITSLEDLTMMPNIKRLGLKRQNISDITPLSELKYLTFLDLNHNPVADLSPLADHAFLADLKLFDTHVTDFSPLKSCHRLTQLLTGKMALPSIEVFKGLEQLKVLTLHDVTLDSLEGIEGFTQLTSFNAGMVRDGDLLRLLSLPSLKQLLIKTGMQSAAAAIQQQAPFTIEYYD